MEFHGKKSAVTFPTKLQPLFNAMMRGDVIKKVTCKDRVLENFTATAYWQGISQSHDGISYDYIDTNLTGQKTSFYMSWVISFEL